MMTNHWPAATRTTDPGSSAAAEAEITDSGHRRTQAEIVLDAVRRYPGRTAHELVKHIETLDNVQITRRLNDLVHQGDVKRGSVRGCGVTHRRAVSWWPSTGERRND